MLACAQTDRQKFVSVDDDADPHEEAHTVDHHEALLPGRLHPRLGREEEFLLACGTKTGGARRAGTVIVWGSDWRRLLASQRLRLQKLGVALPCRIVSKL